MTKDDIIGEGIVGIDENLRVFVGHDTERPSAQPGAVCPEWQEPEFFDAMPDAEKLALADHMIALWQRYREAVGGAPEMRRIGYAQAGELAEALMGRQCDPLLDQAPGDSDYFPVYVAASDIQRIVDIVKAQGCILSAEVAVAEATILSGGAPPT